ncbi:FadR/GntR family transcriptional regulator [Brucella sp. BE17]|uniref:FadR/GntR family transcriptional regulator n=1 Tax=Brucella sp. BE17 TaxID=3142977 RepID=UPI0031BB8E48
MSDMPVMAEPRRLYQQIADRVRERIQDGQFPLGSRLPAERELAQQLGVSRPSLREALIALEIAGTVEIRMGSGIYVSAGPDKRVLSQAIGESPLEIMQARQLIEGSVAVMACARMTPDGLGELRATLNAMRENVSCDRTAMELDRQFHLLLAGHAGNSVLVKVIRDLFDERHSPLTAQIRTRFENNDTWSLALVEHEIIYTALEARDPLQAQAAMQMHLERSRQRWMDNEPQA